MVNEFVTLQEYLKRLRTIYFNALCAFYVYETIEELRAPNIVGKEESSENVNTMNQFNGFLS